jgi:fructose-bisphosphate aldolase class I
MVSTNPRDTFKSELIENAKKITMAGKGILAADESTGTIGKRFETIGVENTTENARAYRELLFTAPEIEKSISGVIMFEDTLSQATTDGTNFVKLLNSRGILAGIKVDKGVVVMGGTMNENATQGLDGLAGRCKAFYEQGCRFAKWRAVLKISVENGTPSELSMNETAHTLARYGGICQDNGLVPIIEPEVMIDGAHSMEACAAISERVLAKTMAQMLAHHLIIEGCLLKPNMVTPGSEWAGAKPTSGEIAWATVRTLSRTMSPALCGVVFLSGGQSEEDASLNLNAMNMLPQSQRPWALTFSYGRAL